MNFAQKIQKLKEVDLTRFSDHGHFKLGFRKSFLDSPILVGRERVLVLPNQEKHRAVFCIIELDQILASHNEQTFSTEKGYPTTEDGRNINDRNYSGDKNAQAKVNKVAQTLEPNILISTTATEESTPIISLDGIVVSGNNRTMSLKLAVSDNYKRWLDYHDVLYHELKYGGYGFSKDLPAKIKNKYEIDLGDGNKVKFSHPVLVRIDLDFPAYVTEEMNKYNVSAKKSERQIDQAIRIAQQLEDNEQCKKRLIELISDLEIVSELYRTPASVDRFKKILLDCNLINENELAKYFQGNTLSANGKTMYEVILSSLILKPKTLEISQNSGVVSATNKVVNAIIPAIKNQAYEIGSLNEDINNAILIQNKMVASKIKDIVQYMNQPELFEKITELTYRSATINYYITLPKQNEFKRVLMAYNDSMEKNQGADMFGEPLSPDFVFESTFVKGMPPSVQEAFAKRFKGVTLAQMDPINLRKMLELYKKLYKVKPDQPTLDIVNSLKILLDEI
jgi:hypothetical protein